MAYILLDGQQRQRVEAVAREHGAACAVCGSPELVARGTAVSFLGDSVRVYLDCARNRSHNAGASEHFGPDEARGRLGIGGGDAGGRRNPGETFPRA